MKTLADMTPQERAQFQGMWCDFPDPDERTNLAIYVGDSLKHEGFCELIHEGHLGTLTRPENLTPRADLPRAWTPDGQPPAGRGNRQKTNVERNSRMTSQDKAASIIHGITIENLGFDSPAAREECERIAHALAAAGLLAPDLPESNGSDGFVPDGKEWLPGGPHGPSVWTAPDSTVMVQRVEPGDLTPDEAIFFALTVLAAAQYAKGQA